MPNIDTRTIAIVGVAAIVLIAAGFLFGRATASTGQDPGEASTVSADDASADSASGSGVESDTETTLVEGDPSKALTMLPASADDIPMYGSPADRDDLIEALFASGVGIASRTTALWVADRTCYDLERLQEQNRPASFAVRVVWNETLSELDSGDAAAFGAVFSAAPYYLCPDSVAYSEKVAYWLGF